MRKHIFGLVMLLIAGGVFGQVTDENISDYFPVSSGNTWTYANAEGKNTRIITVKNSMLDPNTNDGTFLYLFEEYYIGIGSTSTLYSIKSNNVVILAKRNVLGQYSSNKPPFPIEIAPADQKWRQDDVDEYQLFSTSKSSINYDDKSFHDCILVENQVYIKGDFFATGRRYYAKGIGLVYHTIQDPGREEHVFLKLVSCNFADINAKDDLATANTETAETETPDAETAEIETTDTEITEAETAETEIAEIETTDAETTGTEATEIETVETETTDTETVKIETTENEQIKQIAVAEERKRRVEQRRKNWSTWAKGREGTNVFAGYQYTSDLPIGLLVGAAFNRFGIYVSFNMAIPSSNNLSNIDNPENPIKTQEEDLGMFTNVLWGVYIRVINDFFFDLGAGLYTTQIRKLGLYNTVGSAEPTWHRIEDDTTMGFVMQAGLLYSYKMAYLNAGYRQYFDEKRTPSFYVGGGIRFNYNRIP